MGESDEQWSDRLSGVERFPDSGLPQRPAPRQRRVWPWVVGGVVLVVLVLLLTLVPIVLYIVATAQAS